MLHMAATTAGLLLALAVGLTGGVQPAGARENCLLLNEIDKIDRRELRDFGYDMRNDAAYFCAPTAPHQFRCQCGASQHCAPKHDPWGRDLGQCSCCATWVIVLLLFFVAMLGSSLLIAIYGCLCRGRWWCDGHPPPLVPVLARRGVPVIAPARVPLPSNIFRGFRSADFDSGLPPEIAEAEAERRAARRRRREAERASRRASAAPPPPSTPPVAAAAAAAADPSPPAPARSPAATAASPPTPTGARGASQTGDSESGCDRARVDETTTGDTVFGASDAAAAEPTRSESPALADDSATAAGDDGDGDDAAAVAATAAAAEVRASPVAGVFPPPMSRR